MYIKRCTNPVDMIGPEENGNEDDDFENSLAVILSSTANETQNLSISTRNNSNDILLILFSCDEREVKVQI